MKLAKLGVLFRIFAILTLILSLAFTTLVFMDLTKVLRQPSEVVVPSEDMGLSNQTDVQILKENGNITAWKLNLGSISIHNPGERIEFHDLRFTVEMVNESTDEVYIDLKTEKDLIIEPGASRNISLPLKIYRVALLKASRFLYRGFQRELYQAVNNTLNQTLDETTWNASVINATTFNRELFDRIILNGSFIEGNVTVDFEDLLDLGKFNTSLVNNYGLTQADLATVYQNVDEDTVLNNMPNMGAFIDRLLEEIAIKGNLSIFIGLIGFPLTGITVKLEKATIMDMFGGTPS